MGDTTIRRRESIARPGAWVALCGGVILAASVGCAKKADPKECHSACERIARLQTAALQKDLLTGVHEHEERVESIEDQTKADVARIKNEMAQPTVRPDLSHAKLPAAERRKVEERVAYEAAQLKQQRERALKNSEENLRAEQQSFADAKKRATEDLKKAVAAAIAACDARCAERTAADVQCLSKTQALEDIATCERK